MWTEIIDYHVVGGDDNFSTTALALAEICIHYVVDS
jgi:hypothetical protein